jgi:hypothetical protein
VWSLKPVRISRWTCSLALRRSCWRIAVVSRSLRNWQSSGRDVVVLLERGKPL